jgi:hypothetical protein
MVHTPKRRAVSLGNFSALFGTFAIITEGTPNICEKVELLDNLAHSLSLFLVVQGFEFRASSC